MPLDLHFSHQHTQGSTLQVRRWSWCRETDSVLQSRWSPRPHTYTSCREWSLRTSCCPQYAPLLRIHNLRREIKSPVKNIPCCDYNCQWCVYLCSEDSRLLDPSPDAYKAAWDSRETHTAPHLPVRPRQVNTRKEQLWRKEAEVEESDLAGAGGAVVWAQGPCLSVTELPSIEGTHWEQRQEGTDEERNKENIDVRKVFMERCGLFSCFYVCRSLCTWLFCVVMTKIKNYNYIIVISLPPPRRLCFR